MKKLILNGKVRDVRFIVYKIEGGELKETSHYYPFPVNQELLIHKNGQTIQKNIYWFSGQLRKMEKYDENGNTTAIRYYKLRGKSFKETLYKYDAQGNIIEQTKFQNDKLLHKQTFSYDSTGKLVETKGYERGKKLSRKQLYSYDSQGNLQEINTFSSEGKILEKKTFKYNFKNLKTEEAEYNSEGKLLTKIVWEYDKHGNLIQRTRFRGEELKKQVIKYNLQGQKTERTDYLPDGKLSTLHYYEYDPQGNPVIERTVYHTPRGERKKEVINKYNKQQKLIENAVYFYPSGNFGGGSRFQYDKFGNLTEKKFYDNLGLQQEEIRKYDASGNLLERRYNEPSKSLQEIWTYEYEFDEQGNWIKRIDYKDGTAMYLVKREIEYFE